MAPLVSILTEILLSGCRMPVFRTAILSRCQSSLEGLGFFSQIRSAIMARESQGLDLALIAPQVEAVLASRQAVIDRLTAAPGVTAVSLVTALTQELGRSTVQRMGSLPRTEEATEDEAPPSSDALLQALQSQSFAELISTVASQDLQTVPGKRSALAAGFNGMCVIAVRVLCSSAKLGDPIRNHDRTRTLSRLNDLRPDRFDYFNYMLRLDISTAVVPERMMRYSFASSEFPEMLEAFLKFEFETIDWYKAPYGLNGYLQALHSQPKPAVTDTRDYYADPDHLLELGQFGQRLFTALGCTVDDSTPGLNFAEMCSFYAEHIKFARKCATLEDQLKWINESAASFRSSLAAIGAMVRQRVYSADPASVRLPRVLLPIASEQVQACRSKQTSLNTLAELRAQYDSFCPQTGTPIKGSHLPLPSEYSRAQPKSPWKKPEKITKKEPLPSAEEREERPPWAQPGARSDSHKWGNGHSHLYISGLVWNVKGIADRFKLDAKAYCWPYLLASCADHNRASRCDKWGQPGHKSAKDKAHTLPKGVSMKALKEFSRSATAPERETAAVVKSPPKTPRKLRGKGAAKRSKVQGGGRSRASGTFAPDSDAEVEGEEDGTLTGETTVTVAGSSSNGQPASS